MASIYAEFLERYGERMRKFHEAGGLLAWLKKELKAKVACELQAEQANDTARLEVLRARHATGLALTTLKDATPHGEWESVALKEIGWKKGRAEKYMRFAKAPVQALLPELEDAWRKASHFPQRRRPKQPDTGIGEGDSEVVKLVLSGADMREIPDMVKALRKRHEEYSIQGIYLEAVRRWYGEEFAGGGGAPCQQ
jgi:hypothetical protein